MEIVEAEFKKISEDPEGYIREYESEKKEILHKKFVAG